MVEAVVAVPYSLVDFLFSPNANAKQRRALRPAQLRVILPLHPY